MARINKKRNITGYNVQEDATPINAASTEGGVGTIQFGGPDTSDVLDLYGTEITLSDDFRGETLGNITEIVRSGGIATFTADSPLGALVGTKTANPMSGRFEDIARYYMSLGGVTTPAYFDDSLTDMLIDVPGWNDDVWLRLKALCIAYGVQVSVISDNIIFRPARAIVLHPRQITSIEETLGQGDIARAIEVAYNNNVWRENVLVYPRNIAETNNAQVYQVEAGQVLEDDIELTVSLSSIKQPVCVADVTQDYTGSESVYSVRAVDNSLVTPTQWAAGGGKIELTINDDTTSVHIKITASNDEYYGPYRIAGRVYEAPDLNAIIVPPSSTYDAQQVGMPTAPTAPGDAPSAPKSNPTKPRKPAKKTAAEIAYDKKMAVYRAKQKAYDKAMKKYDAATKAAQAEQKRRDDEAAAINDIRQSEKDYPSLRIAGTGVHFDQGTLTLPTGVPESVTASDVGVTVQSVFVDTEAEAYDIGRAVAAQYHGEDHGLSATLTQVNQRAGSGSVLFYTIKDFDTDYAGMTIAQFNAQWTGKTIADFNAVQKSEVIYNFENQVFGNVAGSRFRHGNSMFRIKSATITQDDVQITAVRDTMIEDFNWVHAGQTIADFNALYAGKSLKQFSRMALKGGY